MFFAKTKTKPKFVYLASCLSLCIAHAIISFPSQASGPQIKADAVSTKSSAKQEEWRTWTTNQWAMESWKLTQQAKRATPDMLPGIVKEAKAGNAFAQTLLGLLYLDGVNRITQYGGGATFKINPDASKAVSWLRRAANAGYPIAQTELGEMYYRGHGVMVDLDLAVHWLERASQYNYPRAKMSLAHVLTVRGKEDTKRVHNLLASAIKETTSIEDRR